MHNNVYTLQTERTLSEYGVQSQKKKTLPINCICVSCIGTAGLVTLVSTPSQTNQQINSIIPKSNISSYYIYFLMKSKNELINKLGQGGNTIVNLNKVQFSKMEALIPTDDVMSKFNDIIDPIFNKILNNQKENIELCKIRELLLPRLMSGDLDISKIDL